MSYIDIIKRNKEVLAKATLNIRKQLDSLESNFAAAVSKVILRMANQHGLKG
jgi:hypothetical protein